MSMFRTGILFVVLFQAAIISAMAISPQAAGDGGNATGTGPAASGLEIIPPLARIRADHPRVLLRPGRTDHAISLEQLRGGARTAESAALLEQLRKQDDAASQAMVWLLTGDEKAAKKAIDRMRAYRFPSKVDTFHIYGRLTEMGLAYDWLYGCPLFTEAIRAEVRAAVLPLAREGLRATQDHMFHNYIWMSAGGVAIWAMATAGEDGPSSEVFEKIRQRYNNGLYPAWRYLDGLPSEPMGYWSLYVLTPGFYTLLAAQSAFETDLVSITRKEARDGAGSKGWLDRNFDNLIHSILPDMRYMPWGDLQGGPNGGITHEMAGFIDAATWALKSPAGRQLGSWLAQRRGPARFHGETAIFYFIYTRNLPDDLKGEWPAPSFMAGGRQSGHFIARSAWADDATIVALTCTDHFGDHHHYDQGSFTIYRRGLLAIDPPVYKQTRGPQQKTEYHNTLLIGGKAQRPARGQWFLTVEDFQKNLSAGKRLETGDMPWWHEGGTWAAATAQFAQAYDCPELASCLRQVLYIRPGTVVVVDRLEATPGKEVPEVRWLLQLPGKPQGEPRGVWSSNGKSWIRCRAILPATAGAAGGPAGDGQPAIEPTPMQTQCASFAYRGGAAVSLVHVLEVGDGTQPAAPSAAKTIERGREIEVTVGERTFVFGSGPNGEVSEKPAGPSK